MFCPQIQVGNIFSHVGDLQFTERSTEVIIMVAFAGCVPFILIFIAIIVWYSKKHRKCKKNIHVLSFSLFLFFFSFSSSFFSLAFLLFIIIFIFFFLCFMSYFSLFFYIHHQILFQLSTLSYQSR